MLLSSIIKYYILYPNITTKTAFKCSYSFTLLQLLPANDCIDPAAHATRVRLHALWLVDGRSLVSANQKITCTGRLSETINQYTNPGMEKVVKQLRLYINKSVDFDWIISKLKTNITHNYTDHLVFGVIVQTFRLRHAVHQTRHNPFIAFVMAKWKYCLVKVKINYILIALLILWYFELLQYWLVTVRHRYNYISLFGRLGLWEYLFCTDNVVSKYLATATFNNIPTIQLYCFNRCRWT